MKNIVKPLILKLIIIILYISSTHTFANENPIKISVGIANWALFDDADRQAVHTQYFLPSLNKWYDITPVVLIAWADEGQRYFSAGVNKHFYDYNKLKVGAGFHLGFIDKPEGLGHKVEYYSNLFVDYELKSDVTVRGEIGHISNGGFSAVNPGSESFVLSFIFTL